MKPVSLDDLCRSYRALGHAGHGYTELLAVHPDYRPGRENSELNKRHRAFPRVAYATDERRVIAFAQQYAGTHLVCCSLNPRPRAYLNERGFPRSAQEHEIEVALNLFFDFDVQGGGVGKTWYAAFDAFYNESSDYAQDLGLRPPDRAHSGGGAHLLWRHSPISANECPDLSERYGRFADDFADDFHKEIAGLDATLDRTFDCRRMRKCDGTAKPNGSGFISRYFGTGERIECEGMRALLLSMPLTEKRGCSARDMPVYGPSLITIYNQLPSLVQSLLKRDERLRQLWHGKGKPEASDTSGSGYDMSLARRLVILGVRDIDVLGTTLALRPNGSYRNSNKDERYLRRTIAKALAG